MTLLIIIGVLVLMVYIMQLNIKNELVTKCNLLITLALSTLGILVTALADVIVTKQAFSSLSAAIGPTFTGTAWGLLLSGSYVLIRFSSNTFGHK